MFSDIEHDWPAVNDLKLNIFTISQLDVSRKKINPAYFDSTQNPIISHFTPLALSWALLG